MGEVKRYDMLIDYGCSKFDSPEIDPHEIKDGYWVKHSDYATLEARLMGEITKLTECCERKEAEVAKLRAACAAKDAALRVLDAENNSVLDRVVIAAALALDAGKGWIDASGAVEATCFSHCEVIGREPFGTYRDVGRVEVPKDWAGSRVLIITKPKEET